MQRIDLSFSSSSLSSARRSADLVGSPAPAIVGDLRAIAMPDLLQAVVREGQQGRLDLEHETSGGTLWFVDGRVVDARVPDGRTGLAAALDLVVADAGRFTITLGPVLRPRTIHLALSILLLEAMRRQDVLAAIESGGLEAEVAASEAASFLSRHQLRGARSSRA